MPEEIIIRSATSDDYDGACALLDELDELHRERLPWLFRAPASQPRSRSYFVELLAAEDSTVLVADAGDVVGLAIVLVRPAPDFAMFIPQRYGVLDNIVVLPSWQRRGVGSRLARAAEVWADAKGAAWVELGVYEFNIQARSFYEALGYLPVSTKLRKSPLRE